jgi:hypothetical protein
MTARFVWVSLIPLVAMTTTVDADICQDVGISAEIASPEDRVVVKRVVKGGGADLFGIEADDVIIKVNGKDVTDRRDVALIGPVCTFIEELTILKGGSGDPVTLKLIPRLPPGAKRGDCTGVDPKHAKGLAAYADKNDLTIVIRFTNVAAMTFQGKPKFRPKPLMVKLKTEKKGANCGLVVKPKGKDAEKKSVKKELDELAAAGWTFDKKGVLVDSEGRATHGDYDMQGVYKHNKDGTVVQVDANNASVRMEINKALDPSRTQQHEFLVQHGANDNLTTGTGSSKAMGRLPSDLEPGLASCKDAKTKKKKEKTPKNEAEKKEQEAREEERSKSELEGYLVFNPDGSTQQVIGSHRLEEHYKAKKIPWPYVVRRDKQADPCDYLTEYE